MKTIITIAPAYQHVSNFIQTLPQTFQSQGITIYKARNEIKNFEIDSTLFTVKSYKRPHIINQIAYGTFRQSKSKRAYSYASQLLKKNISTPTPVAYIEQYNGLFLTNSYFVSLFSPESHILRELSEYKVEGNEDLLRALAAYTASIHEQEIYPIDYSPGNVLFENTNGTFTFTLLDINRMKFGIVTKKMAARCFRRFFMDQSLIEFIANEYAKLRGFDPTVFVKSALKYHSQFWKKS
ncbi:MAG: tyrosine protein kinase [Bacteroidetes bacterium]|nr:tyrosine protein kinase [Bacteroidota bacterium]